MREPAAWDALKLKEMRHTLPSPQRTDCFLRHRRTIVAALFVVTAAAGNATAQGYRTDTPDPNARKLQGVALQCVRDPASFPANRAQFEEYFNKFYFPNMTGTEPLQLKDLGNARYRLFRDYLWATENEELQQTLSAAAYAAMGKILSAQNPPYHPAVRYNAILVIGMLDDQYAREGTNPRPPKPYAKSTTALTNLVNRATTSDQFPPAVILGAVIGLERHAQLHSTLQPAAVQAMTAALLKLVGHDQPIHDMDREAYNWLRLRAASALANLGSVGPNNSIHDALVKLTDQFKSSDDRCAAAALLSRIKYEGAKIDAAATAASLFDLARDVAAEESKRAKDFHEKEIGPGGGAVAGAYTPGYTPDGLTPPERFPRRPILARLTDLRQGLQAVRPALTAEDQQKVAAVVAAIDPVRQAAIEKVVELKLTEAIITMADAINAALPEAQPAAAAEPAAEF